MKALKYGVMLLTVLFLSQLHVYAEGNQWAWPVEGQISDYFGTRHGKHYGIDIAAPIGTPVSAIQEGKVTKSYYSSSYGNVIFIKHGEYEAVYAHLNKRYVVQGDYISKGEIIGSRKYRRIPRCTLTFRSSSRKMDDGKKNAMNPLLVLHEQRNETVSSSLYVVQKGDTLVSIARKFRMSVKEIQEKMGCNKSSFIQINNYM